LTTTNHFWLDLQTTLSNISSYSWRRCP